jgi:CubicO group peptidase (beta-lactamase class C family)
MRKLPFLIILLVQACGNTDAPKPKTESSLYFPPITGDTWEVVSPSELGWNTSAIADLDEFVSLSNTRALIVLKDGKIAYEKYNGNTLAGGLPFTTDSYWYWASAGKTLTSFLIGKLEGQGQLSLNNPSNDYLGTGWSSLSLQEENSITVWHHLTMTTGLDYTVEDPDCTDPGCLTFLNEPVTKWFYHNAPYTRLDGVIEGASGQDFETFFEETLANRIGMEGFWSYSNYNHVFYSKPRSMARYGLLILAEGSWNGEAILDNPEYYEQMVNTSQSLNPSYGYLWWLNGKGSYIPPGFTVTVQSDITPNAPDEMFAAMGKNGQVINIVPSQGLVVVRMGENPDLGLVPFTFQDDMWAILNDLIGE